MKNFVSLFLCAVLIFSLTGCGAANSQSKMQIVPAKLSKEEKKILELVDTQSQTTGIFDYNVDNDIKSMSINILELNEDGKWELTGGSSGGMKSNARILISRAKDGISM
ncbi:MAG: hypothetical protein WAX04_10440, partial [Oscillospiraceae bacterium]